MTPRRAIACAGAPGARRRVRRAPGAAARDDARGAGRAACVISEDFGAHVAQDRARRARPDGDGRPAGRGEGVDALRRPLRAVDRRHRRLARQGRGLAVLRERRRGRRRRRGLDAARRRHGLVGLPPLARLPERAGGGRRRGRSRSCTAPARRRRRWRPTRRSTRRCARPAHPSATRPRPPTGCWSAPTPTCAAATPTGAAPRDSPRTSGLTAWIDGGAVFRFTRRRQRQRRRAGREGGGGGHRARPTAAWCWR